MATDLTSELWALHVGFYLGLLVLIYGLVGVEIGRVADGDA
ncbi:hypothetical protein [Natronomonas amylolytica]